MPNKEINYKKIVEKIAEISDRLGDWELEFICGMYNDRPNGFSEREQEKILEINSKYRKCN